MNTVKITLFSIVVLTVVSCGKKEKEGMFGCMTLEQVKTLCIAEGIEIRPNPMLLYSVEIDCDRQYRVEQCYEKQDSYFPFDR